MVMMNMLRMLVDTAFYGAFAGLIARACGGSGAFWGVWLQCLCFGMSCLGRDKRALRLLLLLPMCLGWAICHGSFADCVLLLPTAAYMVWLVWKGDYCLDQDRQRRLFDVFWKVMVVFLPIAMLMGGTGALSAVTVPYTLVMLIGSVLLLRALRHDAKVYCARKYQLVNLSSVAVVAAVAGIVSSNVFLNACAVAWKAFYAHVLQPVFEFILNVFLVLIWGISRLFSLLSVRGKEQKEEDALQLDLGGAQELFGKNFQQKEPGEVLRILGIVLLVAAGVVLLVLFFRWMNRHSGSAAVRNAQVEEREALSEVRRPGKRRETSPVRKIRAQYRGFLKWCDGLGMRSEPGTTTLDIHRQVDLLSEHGAESEQIRELYIQARYAHTADQNGVRAMKELCGRVKKTDAK